jgi:tetratricopeptide (TPR) repeat protein
MRAFVFTDKALQRHAGQFVWLSLDVEKADNAPYRKKYGADALPMFFVVDPKTEKVAFRWVGGASVPQLQKILADGRAAVKGSGGGRGLEEVLARADRSYAAGDYGKAAADYREALRLAPRDWSRSPRATESLLFALVKTEKYADCARVAADAFRTLGNSPSAATVAAAGLDCALQTPEQDPSRAELLGTLKKDAESILARPRRDLAADDVSAVYEVLANEREWAKDEPGRKKILQERATFLEAAAGRAKTPEARAVFDSHRLGTYLDLKEPERAVPMLQASERDLRDDYNPSSRLAVAYKAMKKYDDALAASDRALAKAYGPRKLGILQTRADIYKEMGNLPEAKKTMEEAIELAESLPEGQRSEKSIASLKKKLESL